MLQRSFLGALLLVGALVPLTSCTNDPSLTSIAVSPNAVSTSMTPGLLVYFTAVGSYTHPGHTAVTKDITSAVTWSTSFPQFVSIQANGNGVATVTGYGYGDGQISAAAPGFHGDIVGTATFTIQKPTTTTGVVRSLQLVPANGGTGLDVQFKALGVTADGATVELRGQPVWVSTDNMVATIDKASGLLTKVGPGQTTVTAVYTNPDGTTAIGKTAFTIQP